MSRVHTQSSPTTRAFPVLRWRPNARSNIPWRTLLAALLSVLVPGLGHLAIGQRRRGFALIAATIAIVIIAVAVIPREPFAALAMFARPRTLAGLLIADVAMLIFRSYAVVDVVRSAKPEHSRMRTNPGLMVMLALLLTITAAPHIAVGYYDIVTYRFLDRMFNNDAPRREGVAPTEVQLTREVRLKDGVTPAALPVVVDDQG